MNKALLFALLAIVSTTALAAGKPSAFNATDTFVTQAPFNPASLNGFYVTAHAGYSAVRSSDFVPTIVSGGTVVSTASHNDRGGVGYGGSIGYEHQINFSRYMLGGEIGYENIARSRYGASVSSAIYYRSQIHPYYLDALLVGRYVSSWGVNIFLQAGAAYVKQQASNSSAGLVVVQQQTRDAIKPVIGAGVGYNFTPTFAIELGGKYTLGLVQHYVGALRVSPVLATYSLYAGVKYNFNF